MDDAAGPAREILERVFGGTRVRVGARGDQRAHDRRVVFGGREHQRGEASPLLRGVHRRAAFQKQLHGLDASGSGGDHQWRLAFAVRRVGVRASLQEDVDDRGVRDGGCLVERGHAVAVRHSGLRARADQQAHRVEAVPVRGPVKRRHPLRVGAVDVDALFQERAHGGRVLPLGCRSETRVGIGSGRRCRTRPARPTHIPTICVLLPSYHSSPSYPAKARSALSSGQTSPC